MNNEPITFDEDACAEFIQNGLLERGIVVTIADIRLMMDLELKYMQSIGLA